MRIHQHLHTVACTQMLFLANSIQNSYRYVHTHCHVCIFKESKSVKKLRRIVSFVLEILITVLISFVSTAKQKRSQEQRDGGTLLQLTAQLKCHLPVIVQFICLPPNDTFSYSNYFSSNYNFGNSLSRNQDINKIFWFMAQGAACKAKGKQR